MAEALPIAHPQTDATHAAMEAIYNWNYEPEIDELRSLYANAPDRQWIAMRDLPWEQGVDKEAFSSFMDSKPTYIGLENWVLEKKGGSLDQEAVNKHNEGVKGYIHDDKSEKGEKWVEDPTLIPSAVEEFLVLADFQDSLPSTREFLGY